METVLSTDFAETIRKECGENVFLCYQCQKCSAGCPVAEHFDLAPNQVMRAIQLGQKEMVFHSKTFSLPIIYFTQLMGLAFGLKAETLGLDKHFVDPMPTLRRVQA